MPFITVEGVLFVFFFIVFWFITYRSMKEL